jgi:hypothetical protein
MLIRNLLAAATLSLSVVAPSASFAEAHSSTPQCILRKHSIVSVSPYNVWQTSKGEARSRLGGAEVYVLAEPGLTAEWLRLELTRHFTEMHGAAAMPDCVFALDDVRIDVDSAGPGFSVKLIARDRAKAEELLRRARLLVG